MSARLGAVPERLRHPRLVTAGGVHDLDVRADDGCVSVSCAGLGVVLVLDQSQCAGLGAALLRASALLAQGDWRCWHLRRVGRWPLLFAGQGLHVVELDAVRDDQHGISGVLVTIEGLAIDGALDPAAALTLGEDLLAAANG